MAARPVKEMVAMPLRVGELYATMKLVTSDFDRALDTSGKKFNSFGNMLKSGTQMGANLFAGATTAAVGLGTAAFKVGADYNRMQQTSRAALKSILGSTEAVNKQMDKLDEFAKNSPFSKQTFIQAQQQMLGFGVAAEDVIPALDAIQNGVAAMGGSNEDISSITYALSQMQSQGKLSGETLRDLGVYGLDAASIIADQMGMSGQEIRDMASKPGGIPVDQVWDPLINGLTDRFGGATAEVKQQFDGALDRVKAAWRDTGSVLAEPFIDPEGGGQLVEWTNLFADGLRAVEKQAGPVVDILMGRLAPTIDLVTGGLTKAKDAIDGWDSSRLEGGLDKISQYGPLVASTSAALFTMGTKNVPVIGALGSGMGPVVAGIAALVASSPQLRAVGGDFLQALQPAIGPAGQLAQVLADSLMRVLDRLTPSIGDVLTSVAELAVSFTNLLVPAAQIFTGAAEPLIGLAADLASAFANLPQPVQTAVASMVLMHGKIGAFQSLFKAAGSGIKDFGETVALSFMVAKDDVSDLVNATKAMGDAGVSKPLSALHAGLAGISGGAKSAGKALLSAFGGPVGLAIAGVVGALTIFAQKSAEAQARADGYSAALSGIEGSAEDTARALEEVTKNNLVTGENMDWGWFQKLNSGYSSAADALDAVGISLEDFSDAVNGTETDVENMKRRLLDVAKAHPELSGAVKELVSKLGQQSEASQEAREQNEQLARSDEEAADAAYAAADANRDHKVSLEELNDYRQGLTDKILAQRQAQRDLDEQIEHSGDVLKDAEASSNDYQQSLDDIAKKTANAMEAYAAVGDSEGLQDAFKQGRDGFIEMAEQSGMSAKEAQAEWDNLQIDPGHYEVETNIDEAIAEVNRLYIEIDSTTGEITIDGNVYPAETTLAQLGMEIDEKDGTVTILGEKYPAEATLAQYLTTLGGSEGSVTIDGETHKADSVLTAYLKTVAAGHEYVNIDGKKYDAEKVLKALQGKIKGTSENVNISANTNDAAAGVSNVKNWLAGIQDKTVRIKTIHESVGNGRTSNSVAENGGIYHFADGGHLPGQALIKSPQANLVQWAEPSTHGEAFIPLAQSKRARSLAIWKEVGKRFGIESFATGGLTSSSWTAVDKAMAVSLPAALIKKLTTAITNATKTSNARAKGAKATQKALDSAKKAVTNAQAAAKKTRAAGTAGVKKARTKGNARVKKAQDRLAAAKKRKASKATIAKWEKQVAAEKKARDKAIAAAEKKRDKNNADADKRLNKAKNAQTKATDKNRKAQDEAKDAARKLADKEKELAQVHEKLADAIRNTMERLLDAYTDSFDGADLLANMQEGALNVKDFKALLDELRKQGLSEDLIQQIISQGEVTGAETARSILEGGTPMIKDLNAAAKALLEAAKSLGKTEVIGVKQYADGHLPDGATIQSPTARLIQWAEPSTHGEAFIPFAPSKKARSLAIWEESGRRLGAFKMANGGITSPAATASHPGDVLARISPEDMRTLASMVADATRDGTSEGISRRGRQVSVSARIGGN